MLAVPDRVPYFADFGVRDWLGSGSTWGDNGYYRGNEVVMALRMAMYSHGPTYGHLHTYGPIWPCVVVALHSYDYSPVWPWPSVAMAYSYGPA